RRDRPSKPGGEITTRFGPTAHWATGPHKSSQRARRLSGRLRLPPSCRGEKNKSKRRPRNSHYDWYREWGQVNRGHTSPSDPKGNGGRREILADCLVSGIQVTTALVCGLYNNICVGFPRIEQPAPSGATLERLRA